MVNLQSRQDVTAWLNRNRIERLIIVSPHLDDAVLSLGGMISAAPEITEVVTVHTEGASDRGDEWARACGFNDPSEEHAARRTEDRRAMEHLGCRYHHLGLRSGELTEATARHRVHALCKHGGTPSASTLVMLPAGAGGDRPPTPVSRWLRRLLRKPFGSAAHPEHESTRDCFLKVFSGMPTRLCLYAEVPYSWNETPMQSKKRLSALMSCPLEHVRIRPDVSIKMAAAELYESQADLILGRRASYRRRVLRGDEHLFLLPKRYGRRRILETGPGC